VSYSKNLYNITLCLFTYYYILSETQYEKTYTLIRYYNGPPFEERTRRKRDGRVFKKMYYYCFRLRKLAKSDSFSGKLETPANCSVYLCIKSMQLDDIIIIIIIVLGAVVFVYFCFRVYHYIYIYYILVFIYLPRTGLLQYNNNNNNNEKKKNIKDPPPSFATVSSATRFRLARRSQENRL